MNIKAGTTNYTMNVQLFDDTTGAPKTGLTFESAGINISYARAGAVRVAVTEVTLAAADSAYSSGGFKEIDATNMPGVYRFDVPNAALVTGTNLVTITFLFTGVRSKAVDIGLTMPTVDSNGRVDVGKWLGTAVTLTVNVPDVNVSAVGGATPMSLADIGDTVWDETASDHITADTFGEQCKTDIDAILIDTDAMAAGGSAPSLE